ncbi:MAG: NERD domain-containing protein [Paramuribaculum sp.]|nr:NERD domain-containing protein [Paramuribaculum sp.]
MYILLISCLIIVVLYLFNKREESQIFEQETPISRGETSELRAVFELRKEGINPKAIFHNLYIRKRNGEYTQVDIAVATRVGILVFEVKDYSGWIFGNEHQRYWTQVLAYGKEKNHFYNPIKQNLGHIRTIRQRLRNNPDIPIYSIIVFYGECTLKNITCKDDNTFIIYSHSIREVVSQILKRPDANFGDKHEIMNLFTESVQNGNNPQITSSQVDTASYYNNQNIY